MLACRSGFIEPPLMPAMVVEGLIALGFVVSVVALFTRKPWAWAVTVAAHLFCVGAADVLLALRLLPMKHRLRQSLPSATSDRNPRINRTTSDSLVKKR